MKEKLVTETTMTSKDEVQSAGTQKEPGRLVVFDFDGTSIDGNSPVILYKYLVKKHMLGPTFIFRIAMWGLAYAWHLPQNEAWVRGLVFSAFEGKPVAEVDEFLHNFYDEKIEKIFRPKAEEAMQKHIAAGDTVVVVSATFEPIVLRAMEKHSFEHQVSVKMVVDENGCYTRKVDGTPVEGEEKVRRVHQIGDKLFGAGNWSLVCAYADHYSDVPLLEMAEKPYAVSPGPALKKEAKKRGWEMLEW